MPARDQILECPEPVRRKYRDLVHAQPGLRELAAQGGQLFRPFAPLMEEAFCFFYSPATELAAPDDMAGDKFTWLILQYLQESPVYAALKERTRLDEWLSLAATEEFARGLIEHFNASIKATEAAGAAPPGSRLPVVRILGIELVDRARVGPAAGPLENAILVMAKEIEGTLDTYRALADLCHTWGLERGQVHRLDHAERLALARRLRESQRLRELAAIVGRYRRLALQKQQSTIARVPQEVLDITFGNDPARILPGERMFLAHPVLRYDFYRRFAEARLAVYDTGGPESAGEGPIIACVDTSGSMAGQREIVAKAIAIGLLEIARVKNRVFVAIVFGARDEIVSFHFSGAVVARGPGRTTITYLEGLAGFAAHCFAGGTDYETPLREAMRWIEADRCPQADIVFITDDYCEVSDDFLREYGQLKLRKQFSTFGVIVGAAEADARILRKFSDRVVSASDLTAEIAERIFETV